MAKGQSWFWASLLLSFAAAPVFAQEKTQVAKYEQLIEQLDSDDFDAREEAAAEIARIGEAMRPWVVEGAKGASLERRLRCRQLLKQIDSESYGRQIEKFRAGDESAQSLPGWAEFRERFGDSAAARDLFADIAERDRELLELYDEFLKATRSIDMSTSEVERRARVAIHARPLKDYVFEIGATRLGARGGLPIETLAACILIDCDPLIREQRSISLAVFNFFRDPVNVAVFKKSRHYPVLRAGAARWLSESNIRIQSLMLAMRLEIPEVALALGREAVEAYAPVESSFTDEASEAARIGIIACAKYGDSSDLQRLAPLLSKTIVVQTWITIDNETASGQLRDIALAYSAHLAGVDAKRLGFPYLQESPETIFIPYSISFVEERQREAAHEAWRRLRQGNPAAKPSNLSN